MGDLLADLVHRVRAQRLPPPGRRRRLRRAAGLTQRELAAAVGVARITLARWEAGRFAPRGARRARYVDALARLAEAADETAEASAS